MPEVISFDVALAIGAGLVSVIGVLIAALAHMYFMLVQKNLTEVKAGIKTLHTRMTDHIEKYHTVKP